MKWQLALAVVAAMAFSAPVLAGPHEVALWPIGLRTAGIGHGQPDKPAYAVTGEKRFTPSTRSRELKQALPTGRNSVGIGAAIR